MRIDPPSSGSLNSIPNLSGSGGDCSEDVCRSSVATLIDGGCIFKYSRMSPVGCDRLLCLRRSPHTLVP